jgi:hypothetical protein
MTAIERVEHEIARIEHDALNYEPSPEVRERGHIGVVHDFEGLMASYSHWHQERDLLLSRQADFWGRLEWSEMRKQREAAK